MRTPAGRECPYYYEDYNRGRNTQECRLAKVNPNSLDWVPSDCGRCPVPDIVNANASPDMQLTLTITRTRMGLRRKMIVTATCARHNIPNTDPYVGCPRCAEERGGLDIFRKALEDHGEQDGPT